MQRLSRYLFGLFTGEAMALFGVAAFLLFLVQCLRLFDIVSDKGQSIFTLVGQALLGMPAIGIVFLYVCFGIGIGRALRNLQSRSELQIIHVSDLLPALLRGAAGYAVFGAIVLLLLTHVVDPLCQRAARDWSASIAADVVSRAMTPHKFTSLAGGVSVVIGARDSQGNITDFFADDSRDADFHRTYFARSAIITRDEKGYILRMQDGAVQHMTADKHFSEVSFTRYDIALDQLTGAATITDTLAQTTSAQLISSALARGKWDADTMSTLISRTNESLRVLAMVSFVAALAAFPTGKRRRFELPVEFFALAAAFLERALSSYVPSVAGFGSGSAILLALGLVAMTARLHPPRGMQLRRTFAR